MHELRVGPGFRSSGMRVYNVWVDGIMRGQFRRSNAHGIVYVDMLQNDGHGLFFRVGTRRLKKAIKLFQNWLSGEGSKYYGG